MNKGTLVKSIDDIIAKISNKQNQNGQGGQGGQGQNQDGQQNQNGQQGQGQNQQGQQGQGQQGQNQNGQGQQGQNQNGQGQQGQNQNGQGQGGQGGQEGQKGQKGEGGQGDQQGQKGQKGQKGQGQGQGQNGQKGQNGQNGQQHQPGSSFGNQGQNLNLPGQVLHHDDINQIQKDIKNDTGVDVSLNSTEITYDEINKNKVILSADSIESAIKDLETVVEKVIDGINTPGKLKLVKQLHKFIETTLARAFLNAFTKKAQEMGHSVVKTSHWGHHNHLWRDAIMPVYKKEKSGTLGDIILMLDVSGSISDVQLITMILLTTIGLAKLKFNNLFVICVGSHATTADSVLNINYYKDKLNRPDVFLKKIVAFIAKERQVVGQSSENFIGGVKTIETLLKSNKRINPKETLLMVMGDLCWYSWFETGQQYSTNKDGRTDVLGTICNYLKLREKNSFIVDVSYNRGDPTAKRVFDDIEDSVKKHRSVLSSLPHDSEADSIMSEIQKIIK